MIGRLQGKVIDIESGQLLVDVGGVAYEVDVPLATSLRLAISEEVVLHTHLVIRDDAHVLFGFETKPARALFRALLKVNRVGPRLALTILSGIEVDALVSCIRAGDTKALARVPGVGKKTAERMILDLKDALPDIAVAAANVIPLPSANDRFADAESALVGLGFKPQEAALALARVENQEADVETLIREALKALG
ncbi:MAG: Holliday junction branch migration protein RuvA [Pseudomonadales bacterium]|nr:Holliday junction branch migration protein RuvA [Pseudomonadales bacterium]